MKDKIFTTVMLLILGIFSMDSNSVFAQTEGLTPNKKDMNSYVSIFEIPATDISRAITFYQSIFELSLQELAFPGMHMGLFPTENQMNVGVILKAQDYVPSPNGVTIYFNAGNDLQIILDRIESHGGKIIVPKTPHADDVGFFALFYDTEGNRIGLHSPE